MKFAIPGLTEAVCSSDQVVRNTAIEAISSLSKQGASEISLISISDICYWIDEFRPDLIPAIQKVIQQLTVSKEEDQDEYPLNLIEAMSSLVPFSGFPSVRFRRSY